MWEKQTCYFISNQLSFLSHFCRVDLGSWKRCVSITSIITPVHSWSCARAMWTQITCRNTSVSSTGKPQVHKTSTGTKLNHQKHQTWPSCMKSNTSQTVITSEWEENLENSNSHSSGPVRLQQQRTAYLKLMSSFETICLRTRMLSIPLRNQTEKQKWVFFSNA